MAKCVCSWKSIAISHQFYNEILTRVQDTRASHHSQYPAVLIKLPEGCVQAPTLFSMMFSAMLTDAFEDSDTGIRIMYQTWINFQRASINNKGFI
jgi:hypothetical protein